MVHAVFIQNPRSIYADRPGEAYNFPAQYLNLVKETVGDWIVYYENRTGAYGYVGVQKVRAIIPDPNKPEHYFAQMETGSLWEFETVVPRRNQANTTWESMLRGADGKPFQGGANTLAVRRLPPAEFAAILDFGLAPRQDSSGMPRQDQADMTLPGFAESQSEFLFADTKRDRILTSRAMRDASFARQVKRAYANRCAISGLSLINGGGRPEVEAAHIRSVEDDGPDTVRNGLALSGTLHWMFDRGLIGVAEDHSILISHNKVPKDVADRLILPDQKLQLPDNPRHWPHPEFLRYHREHKYGQFQ